MVIMYLSKENFTCPKEQIMHKDLNLALTVLKPYILTANKYVVMVFMIEKNSASPIT